MPTEPASPHLNAEELDWLNACKDEAIVVTLFERLDAARRELAARRWIPVSEMSRIACMFRGHVWKFARGIYGDEIIQCGYKRNWYECIWCGKQKAMGDRLESVVEHSDKEPSK